MVSYVKDYIIILGSQVYNVQGRFILLRSRKRVLAKLRSTNLRSDLLLAQMFDELVAFFTFHTPYTVLRTLTKIVIY